MGRGVLGKGNSVCAYKSVRDSTARSGNRKFTMTASKWEARMAGEGGKAHGSYSWSKEQMMRNVCDKCNEECSQLTKCSTVSVLSSGHMKDHTFQVLELKESQGQFWPIGCDRSDTCHFWFKVQKNHAASSHALYPCYNHQQHSDGRAPTSLDPWATVWGRALPPIFLYHKGHGEWIRLKTFAS